MSLIEDKANKIISDMLSLSVAPNLIERVDLVLKEENDRRQRFRNEITESDKGEFINGEVFMHSPVKHIHATISFRIAKLIQTYIDLKFEGRVYHEKIMVEMGRNDYEPDISYFSTDLISKFDDSQMIFPAPQLIVEVLSPSTEKNDRGVKFQDYEAHGVEEYWIVDPDTKTIEQYLLIKGNYHLQSNQEEINSKVIKGLKLPIKAVFNEEFGKEFIVSLIK